MPALRFRIQSSLLPCPSGPTEGSAGPSVVWKGKEGGEAMTTSPNNRNPPFYKRHRLIPPFGKGGSGGILGLLRTLNLEILGTQVKLKYRRDSPTREVLHKHPAVCGVLCPEIRRLRYGRP